MNKIKNKKLANIFFNNYIYYHIYHYPYVFILRPKRDESNYL